VVGRGAAGRFGSFVAGRRLARGHGGTRRPWQWSVTVRPIGSLGAAAAGNRVVRERMKPFGQSSDAEQLAHEITSHVAALRRYALVLVGDSTEADDLVQECLSRVLAHMRGWRPVRDLRAYLFTTLHNVFVDASRRQKARRGDVPLENAIATLSLPATQLKRLEFRDLMTALGKLPTQQREVVLLIGLEGMSYIEAARVLGVPIGTVMSRLSRGREALRELMSHGSVSKLRVVK
jgi:RNA polymerase sigma-70 factor (ECF subfamily)